MIEIAARSMYLPSFPLGVIAKVYGQTRGEYTLANGQNYTKYYKYCVI